MQLLRVLFIQAGVGYFAVTSRYFEVLLFSRVYFAEISSRLVRSCLYTYCFLIVCYVICCSQFGYNYDVQGIVSHYGPCSCDVCQLGLDGGVTVASLGLCCQGDFLDFPIV